MTMIDFTGRPWPVLQVHGGLERLSHLAEATGTTSLLITMPNASGDAIRRAMEGAIANQLEVRTVPPVTDLIDGSVDAHRIRRVRVEDLLRRPIVTRSTPSTSTGDHPRPVVYHGGGLARSGPSSRARSSPSGPRRLVLVDRAESPLYLLQRELETGGAKGEARASCASTWRTSRAVQRWIG